MSGSSTPSLPPPSSPSPLVDNSDDYNFDLSQLKPPPSFTEKLWRKTKQDPLVPIGFVATCCALTGGVISMARNRSEASQRFMQLRVGAQAFTLAAVMFALYNSQRVRSGGSAAAAEGEPAAAAPSLSSPAASAAPSGGQQTELNSSVRR